MKKYDFVYNRNEYMMKYVYVQSSRKLKNTWQKSARPDLLGFNYQTRKKNISCALRT